jgi:hypothetical protein
MTQLSWSSGAKCLQQKGVSEDQIRRLGELTITSRAKSMALRKLTRSHYYRQVGDRDDEDMLSLLHLSRGCRAQAGFAKEVCHFGEITLITLSSSLYWRQVLLHPSIRWSCRRRRRSSGNRCRFKRFKLFYSGTATFIPGAPTSLTTLHYRILDPCHYP